MLMATAGVEGRTVKAPPRERSAENEIRYGRSLGKNELKLPSAEKLSIRGEEQGADLHVVVHPSDGRS